MYVSNQPYQSFRIDTQAVGIRFSVALLFSGGFCFSPPFLVTGSELPVGLAALDHPPFCFA
jgi:hypothetical protein